MSVEPGQSRLHYRLVEKIGEGGMGVVRRAADAARLARFAREARLLATLTLDRADQLPRAAAR